MTLVLVFSVFASFLERCVFFFFFIYITFARGDRVTLVLHGTYTGNTDIVFVHMLGGEICYLWGTTIIP